MKARALIDEASYGAEGLPAISKAFDAAWAEIAWIFGKDQLAIETAREQLARAVLSVASGSIWTVWTVDGLKKAALERIVADYLKMVRH